MRGNHSGGISYNLRLGSIPACAGEPTSCTSCSCRLQVYPRVCGGTGPFFFKQWGGVGLSPRVRGNRRRLPFFAAYRRSIPACAGEPRTRTENGSSDRVYPRVCGGTYAVGIVSLLAWGLSPRVRGNLPASTRVSACTGSIPACAGEPDMRWRCVSTPKVYPRVCGGTWLPPCGLICSWGLSPRVRGNLAILTVRPGHLRSIPACAGEPCLPSRTPWSYPVYPRVCGGTRRRRSVFPYALGLSPRVRGNPVGVPVGVPVGGSIPACAGEPGAGVACFRMR